MIEEKLEWLDGHWVRVDEFCLWPHANSFAEFERDLIRERTNAGLSAARARGRKGGRPKGVVDPNKQKAALALKNDTSRSVSEICQILGVCRNTYYKYVRSERSDQDEMSLKSKNGLKSKKSNAVTR